MPKVCEAGTLQDGEGNVFPSLQPPQVRRPPGRPRQRRIESQFSHKRAIHCSRCNGIVIILTMAGNGLDGSAPSSLPLSVRDLQFGGLLNLNRRGAAQPLIFLIQHFNVGFRRIEFSPKEHYPVTSDVGLHYVIKFQIPSVQVPLRHEIKEFGAFGHLEIDFASHRSPTVERTPEPETNVDHDTNVDAENSDEIWHQYHDANAIDQYQRGIQEQLRIMRGLMHKLGTRRHSGVNSDAGGPSSYAPASTPTADDHAFPGDEYMASHAAYHVLDTPDRVVAPEYELQPSVPINVVSDGEEQPQGNVVPTNRNVRRRRVRRMAPNLLSPYISQPQTKQSAIKIDLKQGAALVFGDDLDASEELVSMHDTILTRGNLGCFQGNGWIGNDVVDAYCRLLQYQHEPKSKLFLSPYIAEAVIGRFEPHHQIEIPYVNVNEVFLPVLIKNHWTLYVYDLENRRIQLLDSRPGRKKTMLSGVQQNLAKVVLWLAAHKKDVSPYDLRTFNFITPDVPLQTNEHDCGVFVMKFMELWSMGGFSKSIDVVEDHGEYVVLSTKCTPRPCPERLKGIVFFKSLLLLNGIRPVDGVLEEVVNRSSSTSAGRAHPTG
ncbi:hypothetical protein AAG906_026699 [Vitis piasezkii]